MLILQKLNERACKSIVSAEWVEIDRDCEIAHESSTKECITIELFMTENVSRIMFVFTLNIPF